MNSDGVILKSDRMYKLYSHNDQIGPYVRVVLGKNNSNKIIAWEIGEDSQDAKVESLIIPLDNVIRVKFEDVMASVKEVDYLVKKTLKVLLSIGELSKEQVVEWDVRLVKSNSYKEEIVSSDKISDDIKAKVALSSYPRYLWLANCVALGDNGLENRLVDILYDPSDAPTGFCCFQANFFESNFAYAFIRAVTKAFSKNTNIASNKEGFQVLNENHKTFFIDAYKNNSVKIIK